MKLSKNILGWIMFDFADSAFVTVIVTVVYSLYFQKVVVGSGEYGTALWGRAMSISMSLVAISAPILGAVADYSRGKKKLLFINCYLTVIFTALLYFVHKGDIFIGMLFFIIANFGFNSGMVFYNAFLPEITTPEEMGKVSSMAWGIGYLGGLISLLMILPLAKNHIRLVFPAVASFLGIFAIFTFVWLKEFKRPSKRSNYFKIAIQRITYTMKNISRLKELIKYLFSYLIYNDGITVVIAFASIYGATRFNMTAKQLIIYFILAQLTSFLGSMAFSFFVDKIGVKKSISISLFIWIVVVLGAFFCQTIPQYYIVGTIAGLAIGSSQSNSRTMLAQLTPREKMTEFFGFYSLTGRLASIIGPLVYGEISRITGNQRYAVLSVLVFFITGFIFLQFVNEDKGKLDALSFSDEE